MTTRVAARPAGDPDVSVLTVTAVLVAAGLVMIFSASTVLAMKDFGDAYFFIKRQLLWAALGVGALAWLSRWPVERFRRLAGPALAVCVALLLAVLVLSIGRTAGGARRWLSVGPFSFQPAELVKVALVVYLADVLARRGKRLDSFSQGLLPPLVVIGSLCVLLLMQPDLGTAIILVLVGAGMLFAAGARLSHLGALALAALPAVFLLVMRVGYRRRRLDAFLDPWQDPLGKGFQIIQSFLALGSGGLWGRGLCESQQKLFYLPAPHTDFIFSILGEELGFAGTFAVLFLFGFLVWRGWLISRHCGDPFGKLLALGVTLLLGVQAVVNMGVATGLMPTKGTTLPFISAGGSSLFFSLAAVGILLAVSRAAERSA